MSPGALEADALRALAWGAVLAVGLVVCVGLARRGVARTYVRDLLHVGAGVWVLDLAGWREPWIPTALTAAVAVATVAAPFAAARIPAFGAFRDSVSGDDERWAGLALYTVSFAAFTAIGVRGHPVPSAVALAALALGDGVGGAVGRRFGRLRYRVPGSKPKSVEGTLAVAGFAAAGALGASLWLGAPLSATALVVVGVVGALAEALAPRSSDNLLVPVAVFAALAWM